jgi:hypothetical protein
MVAKKLRSNYEYAKSELYLCPVRTRIHVSPTTACSAFYISHHNVSQAAMTAQPQARDLG